MRDCRMALGQVMLRRREVGPRGDGKEDKTPRMLDYSPPPALPNTSPKAGKAENPQRQGLGRGKEEGKLFPVLPTSTGS